MFIQIARSMCMCDEESDLTVFTAASCSTGRALSKGACSSITTLISALLQHNIQYNNTEKLWTAIQKIYFIFILRI